MSEGPNDDAHPRSEWRQQARAALEKAGGSREQVNEMEVRCFSPLVEAAQLALAGDADTTTWTETRDRLKRVRQSAQDLFRALQALTDNDLKVARGHNPYDPRHDLDEAALKIMGRAHDERLDRWLEKEEKTREELLHIEAEYESFFEKYIKDLGEGVLGMTEFPALNDREASADDESLAHTIGRLEEAVRLRLRHLSLLKLGGPGRGKLHSRLGRSPKQRYLGMCCQLFHHLRLPVSDTETGAFFQFCAAIYDHSAEDAMFSRDKPFRDIVNAYKEIHRLDAEAEELHNQILNLPGRDVRPDHSPFGVSTHVVSPEALPEQRALNMEMRDIEIQIRAFLEEVFGPQRDA